MHFLRPFLMGFLGRDGNLQECNNSTLPIWFGHLALKQTKLLLLLRHHFVVFSSPFKKKTFYFAHTDVTKLHNKNVHIYSESWVCWWNLVLCQRKQNSTCFHGVFTSLKKRYVAQKKRKTSLLDSVLKSRGVLGGLDVLICQLPVRFLSDLFLLPTLTTCDWISQDGCSLFKTDLNVDLRCKLCQILQLHGGEWKMKNVFLSPTVVRFVQLSSVLQLCMQLAQTVSL